MDHDRKASDLRVLQILIAQSEDDARQGRWLYQEELEELLRRRFGITSEREDAEPLL